MLATVTQTSALVPERVQRIYLTGFMGAGKSTVGALLARNLRWQFLDLDNRIEERTGKPVPSLFADHGEDYFRGLELALLDEAKLEMGAVIALGAGAIETRGVRSLIVSDNDAALIFLEAPLSHLVNRCLAQEQQSQYVIRPLLQETELLQSRYDRRRLFYEDAHLIVATEFSNPEEVAAAIYHQVVKFTAYGY